MPRQLLKLFLQSVQGAAGKHPGISKIMQEIRQKCYFPSVAAYVRDWVRDCEICIQDKHGNYMRTSPELFNNPEWDLAPEGFMKIDLEARIFTKWGIREYLHSVRCIFEICICLSSFQAHGSKHSESHN